MLGGTSIGNCSTTLRPKASIPVILRGLFVRILIVESPRSARICDPIPYSRRSGGKPSSRLASTVSSPFSCNSYAFSLARRPMPRPSCVMYRSTPRSSAPMRASACSSCSPQSQRKEWNTSPVLDQVGDRDELEVVLLAVADQIRNPGHRSVLVHDLADDAGRVQPGQPGQVDRSLGLAGALKHSARSSPQREHVPRLDDGLRALRRV